MRTTILLSIEVEHDGDLTPKELADSCGVWLTTHIEDGAADGFGQVVTTDDEDRINAAFTVVDCTGASILP